MEMEVVGRHAMLIDDDTAAAFVNSGEALVDWNSLLIDRYDVRHLLSSPPPSRNPRPLSPPPSPSSSHLDHERYLDLFPCSLHHESDVAANSVELGGYHSVAFSYGNAADNTDQMSSADGMGCSDFQPPFPIPESLLHCLPPTEKVHQIIARTALFVSKNGGQSEIVLRVKQGNNPTFAFLMPDNYLHPYFRYLIDHQDLLKSDLVAKSESKDQSGKANGALSLLGSIYGSGDDEDSAIQNMSERKENKSGKTVDASVLTIGTGILARENEKDEALSEHLSPEKENIQLLKKNTVMKVSKAGIPTGKKKEPHSSLTKFTLDKSSPSASVTASTVEPVIVEPPSDIKKLVDRVVEFILKNGPQFEAVLTEQDNKYGRFPFLLCSNPFNSYYVNVLRKAQESKLLGKMVSRLEMKSSLGKQSDLKSLGPATGEIPNDYDRKEKFKMVLGKSKKDSDEAPSSVAPSYTIDAAQTAAILQAATRGVKSSHFVPNISLNGDIRKEKEGEAQLTEEQKVKAERLKRAKMFVSMLKSGAAPLKSETPRSLSMEPLVSGKGRESSVTNDESEKKLSDSEIQERISKRKYRSKSSRYNGDGQSDESEDAKEENNEKHSTKERQSHRSSRKNFMEVDEEVKDKGNRHGKRKHRSHRSSRDNDLEEEEVDNDGDDDRYYRHDKRKHRSRHSPYENDEEEEKEEGRDHTHGNKKHRSNRSSRVSDVEEDEEDRDNRPGKRKHRSHRSSHKDEKEKDDDGRDHKKSRKKHCSHYSSDEGDEENDDYEEKRSKKKHRSRHSSRRSKNKHKHSKQLDEDQSNNSSEKLINISQSVKDLEEGEISSKRSEKPREASIDISSSYRDGRARSQPSEATEVPDDLRAKIRAMLMANF